MISKNMNLKIKNTIGVVVILVLLAVGFASLSYVGSYKNSVYPPSFTVSGEGKVVAVPDVAKFSFGVITQGGIDVAALQTENTSKANAVIDYLKQQGIDDEDIKTSRYDITPRRNQNFRPLPAGTDISGPSDRIIGYTVSQSIEVTVRDFDQIGTVLSGVVEAGANNVSNFRFTFDDPIELMNEARELAIAEAKRRAELMADSAGFEIGRLLSINENNFSAYDKRFGMGGSMDMVESSVAPAPTIEPGSEEIMVTIMLNYEIKD